MARYRAVNGIKDGTITPPPSKSLTHRAFVCAALADGESRIDNALYSGDTSATMDCLSALGARFTADGGSLKATGGFRAPETDKPLDCGSSASALRFLIPVASAFDKPVAFKCSEQLYRRPLGPYAGLIGQDLSIAASGDGPAFGFITTKGGMKSGKYHMPGDVSSQFISGLMFALPLLDGDSEIVLTTGLESKPYVDMTVDVLARFGITINAAGNGAFFIKGGQRYRPACYAVENDYSQAAFFLCAAALGAGVKCNALNPEGAQGDKYILNILKQAGANVGFGANGIVSVTGSNLKAIEADARQIPDLIPPVTVLCCFCEGTSRVINAGRLRLKESDRLRALASEFGRLGAKIKENADSLEITGVKQLKGGYADSHGDHRIAMALAAAAVRCESPVVINGWECVDKSYPQFWDHFNWTDTEG